MDEANERFGQLNYEEYISLKYVVQLAVQKIGLTINRLSAMQPSQPTFIRLANVTKKGCNAWTKLFLNKNLNNKSLNEKERKWDESLGSTQGTFFWDRCYKNVGDIFYHF